MIKKQFKRGIAMIELIFALVIMGIALLSAPMLIQQSIKSSNVALQQESIAALASHTGILLSKYWDEADSNYTAGVAPIITLSNPIIPVVAGVSPFDFAGISMADTNVTGRTQTIGSVTSNISATLGQDNGPKDLNDIDDYIDVDIKLTVFNGEDAKVSTLGDYVDTKISIGTVVTFADDTPNSVFGQTTNAGNKIFDTQQITVGKDSNIKFISTKLTTNHDAEELQKEINLQAFSCNLGSYSLGEQQVR